MTRASDLAPARACVCFALRKVARSVSRRFDAALRPAGLKVTQFNLLVVLDATGAITTTALARKMAIERTTLTRNLALLVDKGWVRGEPGADRRSHKVAITARGRNAARRALPAWRRAQTAMLAALGTRSVDDLMAQLDKLTHT